MINHTPDTLPSLHVEIPADAYGVESTFVQTRRPATPELAHIAFAMCQTAILRQTPRLENMYPAHVGGMERQHLLVDLAKQCGVELRFPEARKQE